MAQTQLSASEKTLTHIYVRDAQKCFVRPCWSSGTDVYCGMCMRGTVRPVVGEVCPICSSTVERILEVATGGAPRVAPKHKDCSIRVGNGDSESGSGVLLDFPDSRRGRA
jgi:hypothetical protein